MIASLNINSWDHVCPVLLPLGAPTMSTVFSGSMGILVPFILFVIAYFNYLHTLWMQNVVQDSVNFTILSNKDVMENSSDVSFYIHKKNPGTVSMGTFSSGGGRVNSNQPPLSLITLDSFFN